MPGSRGNQISKDTTVHYEASPTLVNLKALPIKFYETFQLLDSWMAKKCTMDGQKNQNS